MDELWFYKSIGYIVGKGWHYNRIDFGRGKYSVRHQELMSIEVC